MASPPTNNKATSSANASHVDLPHEAKATTPSVASDETSSSETDIYAGIRVTRAQAKFFFPPLPERCIVPDDEADPSRNDMLKPPSLPAWATTPVTLPADEMDYWCEHGHPPRDSRRTHDSEGRDLERLTSNCCSFSDYDFTRAHPDIHLPPDEGLYFYKHGCLPPGNTRTYDLRGLPLFPADSHFSERIKALLHLPMNRLKTLLTPLPNENMTVCGVSRLLCRDSSSR